ncbi:hypothetical protein COX95_02650 [bacterium CG_4_10_14_0_2_um_filter_33_32]|nr:MAG: hypothetical protein AUJ93_00630 [bacterium CG2_30_33_46]PIR68044.1 MAG: hypothetical protein COU50_00135 [bacterium CG10_big_fil_rev_8_21_14_0_10_33_18]PIU76491.1 MAG: hypothetical protein COS74_03775 [bacterium CG06_land_8_20_14_3_00_33_50]PIW81021.1 MAG: hypothetical protein COZ97_03905 [bacterium CG_4_8_14_3_um_filter_33_28]PIY85406.1 MAG: hypothetical protein COY76_02365 [bacterium CG_4_10_14_0_8_um_filter_33_57]PIZ85935.1 MAG: hypothetical protein COX95_02650 [bacterium CG_4_10_1
MLSIHEKQYKFCPSCKNPLKLKEIDGRKRLNCTKCGFIFWNNPKSVTSILLHKGKDILLLKRAKEPLKDYWCFPGGYVNYDETVEQVLKREASEEIGVSIKINGLIGVYRIDNDPRGINLDLIYEGEIAKGKIRLSDEHSEYKFFSPDKLLLKIAYKHQQAIEDWRKNSI